MKLKKLCSCGCGKKVRGDFASGHDTRMLMNRVRQVGTVLQFCDWFDSLPPSATGGWEAFAARHGIYPVPSDIGADLEGLFGPDQA